MHALRQAIHGRGGGVSCVDHCWLIMFLFEVVLLVGKEGELWWDAGDDCVGGLNFGGVGGVAVAGDDGVGDVGAGPSLSSTQHY